MLIDGFLMMEEKPVLNADGLGIMMAILIGRKES